MKRKLSNWKLFYFFKQLFHNEHPDHKSESKKSKVAAENVLRWEDDGGPVVQTGDPIPQVAENETPQPKDAADSDSV